MIPVACYRLISNNLTVIAGYFPLPGQIKQPQTDSSIIGGISLPLPVRIMAYPLTWLTLITITTGTYLMNEYVFVKERKAKKDLSLYLPLSERSAPLFQIFFQFFYNFFFSSMDSTRRNTYLPCIYSFRFFFVEQCINQFLILLWQP